MKLLLSALVTSLLTLIALLLATGCACELQALI